MRCPDHIDRIAVHRCTVCGERWCAACAPQDAELDEPVCRTCAAAMRRTPKAKRKTGRSRSGRAGEQSDRGRGARLLLDWRFAAVLGLFLVIVGFVALRHWPRADDRVDDSPKTLSAAYDVLEQVGLALEGYRAREGVYPETLAQLVPSDLARLPADPFSDEGAPLLYVSSRAADGLLLYSRGPDGLDQRGRPARDGLGPGDLLYPVW